MTPAVFVLLATATTMATSMATSAAATAATLATIRPLAFALLVLPVLVYL